MGNGHGLSTQITEGQLDCTTDEALAHRPSQEVVVML